MGIGQHSWTVHFPPHFGHSAFMSLRPSLDEQGKSDAGWYGCLVWILQPGLKMMPADAAYGTTLTA